MTKKEIEKEIIATVFLQRQLKYEMSVISHQIKNGNKKLDKLFSELNKNKVSDNVMELDLSKCEFVENKTGKRLKGFFKK